MIETVSSATTAVRGEVAVRVVDTDVHPAARTAAELREYLPEPWRSQRWPEQTFSGNNSSLPYVPPGNSVRTDALGPGGSPSCSDPELTERHLFGDAQVDYSVLIPLTVRSANPEQEAALAAATNNWLAETWLSRYNRHGRYRGTLRVSSARPLLAAREIERWGGHPMFAQVMLNPYASAPYGQAPYYPIYEACARHDLPITLHLNRVPGMALLSPVGASSYFFEHHATGAALYLAHLVSLVCEGVFERFPTLRFVFVEGGSAWLPPLLWRLDKHWKVLRSEAPWLKRKPSEYVRDHIRFSTQPIEEPADPRDLYRVFDLMDADHALIFATDYR